MTLAHILGLIFILALQSYMYDFFTRLMIEQVLAVIGLILCVVEFILGFIYSFTYNTNEKSV